MFPMKTKTQWILLFLVAGSITYFVVYYRPEDSYSVEAQQFWWEDFGKDAVASSGQLCQLPLIHPFDPSIISYIRPPLPIRCKYRQGSFTYIDEAGVLVFNTTGLLEAGYDQSSLKCQYRTINRKNGTDEEVEYGTAIPMTGHDPIDTDFVAVKCNNFLGINVYSMTHAHVHRLMMLEQLKSRQKQPWNVLIFGLDSVSRLNFIRQLPKTHELLVRELDFVELKGFTKVGDNTYPNIVSVLSGCPASSFKDLSADELPLVWNDYGKAGYVTLFAEDMPQIGAFNYGRTGFLRMAPTHHYARPFWLVVEPSGLHRLSSTFCYGSLPKHLIHLDYVKRFLSTYGNGSQSNGNPFFAFSFLTEISHDFLNQIRAIDNDLYSFFTTLKRENYFDNTITIIMSDHGHRFDSVRFTDIGRIEDAMPFAAIHVPSRLLKENPDISKNLQVNSRRLSSMFDLHATLIDILSQSTDKSLLLPPCNDCAARRGISLLSQELPRNRTCEAAGIPEAYCFCQEEKLINSNDTSSVTAAKAVVTYINRLLTFQQNLCAVLSLSRVQRASVIKDGHDSSVTRVRITIETSPGRGLFEALVLFNEEEHEWRVIDDISRINRYGNQPNCLLSAKINNTDLKPFLKFCYCQSLDSS